MCILITISPVYKVLTTSQPDYLHNLISVQSSGRTRSSSVVTLARPSIFLITTAVMHHIACGISSLRDSVNLILSTLPLIHLILHIGPCHLITVTTFALTMVLLPSITPRPFSPDLKLIFFSNLFLHSHSYSFRTVFMYIYTYMNMTAAVQRAYLPQPNSKAKIWDMWECTCATAYSLCIMMSNIQAPHKLKSQRFELGSVRNCRIDCAVFYVPANTV